MSEDRDPRIDPRIERVIHTQLALKFVNLPLALAGAGGCAITYVGTTWLGAIAFIGLSVLFFRSLNRVTAFLLQMYHYRGDMAQSVEDAKVFVMVTNEKLAAMGAPTIPTDGPTDHPVDLPIKTIVNGSFEIVNKPEPYARFMDADIYPWIEIKGRNGIVLRATHLGTMDIARGSTHVLPEGAFMIPPGIVYQVEPIVNTHA